VKKSTLKEETFAFSRIFGKIAISKEVIREGLFPSKNARRGHSRKFI